MSETREEQHTRVCSCDDPLCPFRVPEQYEELDVFADSDYEEFYRLTGETEERDEALGFEPPRVDIHYIKDGTSNVHTSNVHIESSRGADD